MDDLTVILEEQRTHLRAVAYRLLGSVHESDDAVQETWLRLERSDVSDVDNLPAWLTTVVSRICLDQLRSRASRREDLGAEPAGVPQDLATDPAAETEHADAVGRALMVVLDTLAPAERLAYRHRVHRRGWRDPRDRTARRRSGAARPALTVACGQSITRYRTGSISDDPAGAGQITDTAAGGHAEVTQIEV
jgi:DNA-directed RNA polymerase specialized sigma24 family protein